jgi:RimJ/RimL family protein N-acetyltransferase
LPIRTERLILRPYTAEDLDDLFAIRSRPDVVRYLYWEVATREQMREILERSMTFTQLARDGDKLVLAVVLPDAGGTHTGVIGEMTLFLRSAEHRQGEVGFVFHPDFQGKGYATEASIAVLDLAFAELGLHRVYGRADARNAASIALMKRLGMRQEAHFVHNEIFKGEWGDEVYFAILEDEWRARRTEMSAG